MRLGNDRRQGLLKEAQVARLYGDQVLRDIAYQSEMIPLPVPLALGCGYVANGHWAPARKDFSQHNTAASRSLREKLAHPFAGADNLYELRRDIANACNPISKFLKTITAAPPGAVPFGAGFTSLSALINEATVNGKRDYNNWYQKASNTTAASAAYDPWLWVGQPAAGTIPAAGLASTALLATTAGAMLGQGNAPASNTKHLVSATAMSTIAAGSILLHDRTLCVQPILATTTSQTITGSPTRYQSNGNNGVQIWNFKGGTADANGAPNITVTYTESTAGTTGHTTGALTGITTNVAWRTELLTGQFFLPMASLDVGVRRIEGTTWSVARSQATWFGMAYPYCFVPLGVANAIFGTDLINTQFNLVQVVDTACISFFLMAATTTSGLIQGELVLVSGNS
jgi:hypothetical protein